MRAPRNGTLADCSLGDQTHESGWLTEESETCFTFLNEGPTRQNPRRGGCPRRGGGVRERPPAGRRGPRRGRARDTVQAFPEQGRDPVRRPRARGGDPR